MPIQDNAQGLIDDIDYDEDNDEDNDIDVNIPYDDNDDKIIEDELHISIQQELTVPMEKRDVYWAQTLIDSV